MKETEKKQWERARSTEAKIDCRDNVRFILSDETGVLQFKSFDIVNTPQCAEVAVELRKHLVGRPLQEIDMDAIRSVKCPHDNGSCIETAVKIIEENIDFFS